MGGWCMMNKENLLPEIVVFAGPNGSGKSTVTSMMGFIEPYINADDIKRVMKCTDLEAAIKAEELRESAINKHESFTFETVLSTERNLNLLKRAKGNGYFIRGCFVLTRNANINISRVKSRVSEGGHDVPVDKIISRYQKSLALLPELVAVCDILNVYDNTMVPTRIFKKKKDEVFYFENNIWSLEEVKNLVGVKDVRVKGILDEWYK